MAPAPASTTRSATTTARVRSRLRRRRELIGCGRSRCGHAPAAWRGGWPRDPWSLACASVDNSDAADDRFGLAAGRQAGRYGDTPFLTWYDDRRGERVELSFRTFDNWVAKTANLLVDELGAGPGDRVGALLVDHWQAPIVLAACWRAGVGVVALDPGRPGPPPGGLAAVFVREELLAGAAEALEGTPLVALTADLLGRATHDLGRALSFSRVVPTMADRFDAGPDPAGDALVAGDG